MVCYALAAPALLYVALFYLRNRQYAAGVFHLSISVLFCWYLFDLTLISAGVEERQMRWVATPITIVAALSALMLAVHASRTCRLMALRRKRRQVTGDRVKG